MLIGAIASPVSANSDDRNATAWAALAQGGHVIVMRHSLDEPGTGDPPGYRFGDCATQRQLNPEGRAKAARVAQEFRKRSIRIGAVLSSEWCRVRDTAQIVFGRHETWVPLNVQNPQTNPFMNRERQNADLTARIRAHRDPDNLALVTHWLNIVPLLGEGPDKGDALVVRWDDDARRLKIVGKLRFE
jgi:phosphohistidine phosphatase SixA